MFNTDPTVVIARKEHRCTWCSQAIAPGDSYRRWTTFDDAAFVSKMHPECVGACDEECREYGESEYIPWNNERPPAASENDPKRLSQMEKGKP